MTQAIPPSISSQAEEERGRPPDSVRRDSNQQLDRQASPRSSRPFLLSVIFALMMCACFGIVGLHASDSSCPLESLLDHEWRPSLPRADPVLRLLGNTHYNATTCSWTFHEFEQSYINFLVCEKAPLVNVHTCPVQCLRALAGSAVYGSFPYHSNSSICLAAIHAGIITDEAGGGLFVDRFYPQDWSGTSSQTIFPFNSQAASFSNGVQSLAVPSNWYTVPSSLQSYSWTVRSRGVIASRRQTAPFSPRAGHASLRFFMDIPNWQDQALIVGGMNGSHFFNDLWLYQANSQNSFINYPYSRNGRWWRLPDAPFSPRAYIMSHVLMDANYNSFNDTSLTWSSPAFVFIFLGGQTGFQCGNIELALCESDVWTLRISRNYRSSSHGLSLAWSSGPAGRMPFKPRCHAQIIADVRVLTSGTNMIVGVVGGQESRDGDDCAAPIVTVNTAWYSSLLNLSHWRQGRTAPFTPRRSMQIDNTFISDDSIHMEYWGILNLDKSVSLAGGMRYLDHAYNKSTDTWQMTSAELYADVWSCTLTTPEYDSSPIDCDWWHTTPIANTSHPGPFKATGSLPVPMARSPSKQGSLARQVWNARWGGVTSQAAMDAWQLITPTGAMDAFHPVDWSRMPANVTLIRQPITISGEVDPSPTSLLALRYSLPMTWQVERDELNDAASSFALGSDVLITHTLPPGWSRVQPQLTTFHRQASQMVQTPENSTIHLLQSASAVNTTRPFLDASNRRIGHAVSEFYEFSIISGGWSEGTYSNDWMVHGAQSCLFPDDPSYRSLLGTGFVPFLNRGTDLDNVVSIYVFNSPELGEPVKWDQVPRMMASNTISFECEPGHHFEPRQREPRVRLTCMSNGLWMDATLGSIRRCVPNQLQCEWPWVDMGYEVCIEPMPVVSRVSSLIVPGFVEVPFQPVTGNPAGIVLVPYVPPRPGRNHQLFLEGEWLSLPLKVMVVNVPCYGPEIRNSSRWCRNTTRPESCREFGTVATCTVPGVTIADHTPVFITMGSREQTILTVEWPDEPPKEYFTSTLPISISWAPPRIHSLSAFMGECTRPEDSPAILPGLRLVDCPNNRSFIMEVCVVNSDPLIAEGYEYRSISLSTSREPLTCRPRGWTSTPLFDTATPCNERVPDLLCYQHALCNLCIVPPQLGYSVQVSVQDRYLNNLQQNAVANWSATVSFAPCRAGSFITLATDTDYSARTSCVPCKAGTSTNNQTDQQTCYPCSRGWFNDVDGASTCLPCEPHSYAALPGQTECTRCPPNSWQDESGQPTCQQCGYGLYLRWVDGKAICETLPDKAAWANGTLIALGGSWLVVDPDSGILSSAACSPTACLPAGQCDVVTVEVVPHSRLPVANCCGVNRHPAISEHGVLNVLCAACLDGYSNIFGECVPCDAVQWGPLIFLLFVAFVAVYLLHRIWQFEDRSATLHMIIYQLQMADLFMANQALPLVLSFVNLDLLGNTGDSAGLWPSSSPSPFSTCVVPLSDYGKILVQLLSPVYAVFCLMILLALHLLLQRCVRRSQWVQNHQQQRGAMQQVSGLQVQPSPPLWLKISELLLPVPGVAAVDIDLEVELTSSVAAQSPVTRLARIVAPSTPTHGLRQSLLSSSDRTDGGDDDDKHSAANATHTLPASVPSVSPLVPSCERLLAPYRRSLLRLMLFSYTTITAVTLAFFHVQVLSMQGQRLWAYPSVDPASSEYAELRPLVVVTCIVVVGGGPVALLAYLSALRKRRSIGIEDEGPNKEKGPTRPAGSMLVAVFKPSYWWWAVTLLLRRLVLIIVWTFTPLSAVFVALASLNGLLVLVQAILWPYALERDNWLELLALSTLWLEVTLLAGWPQSSTRPAAISAGSLLLSALPCLVVGVRFTLSSVKRWKRQWGVSG